MNQLKSMLKIFAFSLLILGLPVMASAQYRNDDDYYGNRRNNTYNNRTLIDAVRRIESNSRSFRRALDRELDRTRYNESRREDRINDITEQFATAADNLEDSLDNGRNLNRSASRAQQVLRLGNQIDRFMARNRFSSSVERQWSQIRNDLQIVARAYGNSGRYNRRNDDYRDDDYGDDDYRNDDYRNDRRRRRGSIRETILDRLPF
ncbi:MAG TPA: hypothetical protein VEX64_02320 [Pyrinomonadaceae bacterium]|jgi:hypothetical protein|nr:hypothetical protein [Pyrinomonadaceae bacterium]